MLLCIPKYTTLASRHAAVWSLALTVLTRPHNGRQLITAVCPSVQMFLLLSVSQAFLLNMCIFWCTTVNSPLATTVTGACHQQPSISVVVTVLQTIQISHALPCLILLSRPSGPF